MQETNENGTINYTDAKASQPKINLKEFVKKRITETIKSTTYLKSTLDYFHKLAPMQTTNVNIVNSAMTNERVILILPITCTVIDKANQLILTNLRLCFAKQSIEPLRQVLRNEVNFIPLQQVEILMASNTFLKQWSGLEHKLRINLLNIHLPTKFEEFQRLQTQGLEELKPEAENLQFNIYLDHIDPTKLVLPYKEIKKEYDLITQDFTKYISLNTDRIKSDTLLKLFSIKELVTIRTNKQLELVNDDAEELDEVKSELLLEECVQDQMKKQEQQNINPLDLMNKESFVSKQGNTEVKDHFQEATPTQPSRHTTARKTSDKKKKANPVLIAFRKELIVNLVKHKLEGNNLNFDINFILDTFFDEEDDQPLHAQIQRDVAKLFNYISSSNQQDFLNQSPTKKGEPRFEDPDTDLRSWTRLMVKSHQEFMNDKSCPKDERLKFIRKLALNLFNNYKSDDENIAGTDYIASLKEVSLDPDFILAKTSHLTEDFYSADEYLEAVEKLYIHNIEYIQNNEDLEFNSAFNTDAKDKQMTAQNGDFEGIQTVDLDEDRSSRQNQLQSSLLASYIPEENNLEELLVNEDQDPSTQFPDLKVITKKDLSVESLEQQLTAGGIDQIVDQDTPFQKIIKGQAMIIKDTKLQNFNLVCNFLVLNQKTKSVLIKAKNGKQKVPLIKLRASLNPKEQIRIYEKTFSSVLNENDKKAFLKFGTNLQTLDTVVEEDKMIFQRQIQQVVALHEDVELNGAIYKWAEYKYLDLLLQSGLITQSDPLMDFGKVQRTIQDAKEHK